MLLAVSVTIRRWGVRALGISLQPMEKRRGPVGQNSAVGQIRERRNTFLVQHVADCQHDSGSTTIRGDVLAKRHISL